MYTVIWRIPRSTSVRWITIVPKDSKPLIPPSALIDVKGIPLLESLITRSQSLESCTRKELLTVIEDLRKIQESQVRDAQSSLILTEDQQIALTGVWDKTAERCEKQVRTLLPKDLAYLLSTMATCDRRYSECVKAINQHIRRITMSFTPDDMVLCLESYGHMKWRTKGTIAAFAKRYNELLGNPKSVSLIEGRHLRKIIGLYPTLRINWVPNEEKFSLQHPEVKLWLTAANRIPAILNTMTPRDFSVLLNAYAKQAHTFAGEDRGEKTVTRLFESTLRHLAPRLAMEPETFTPRDVALLCHAYGIITGNALHKPSVGPILLQPFFEAVRVYTEQSDLETWSPLDMALVCNSFTKLDFVEHEVFHLLAPHIIDRIRLFTPQNLSNVAHAYAKVQVKNEPLLDRIGDMAARTMNEFSPQALGNIAYAYGKLYHKHDEMMGQLKDEVIYRATVGRRMKGVDLDYRFDLRTVEQLSHAFSRLHYHDTTMFNALFYLLKEEVNRQAKGTKKQAPRVSDGMEAKLDAKGLSVILTSLVKSQVPLKGLTAWATRHFFALEQEFNSWQLVTIFSALSRMGFKHGVLFEHVTWLAKERITSMSPKALAILIHSLSQSNLYDRVLFRQWVKQGHIHLKDFDGVDLLQISTALSDQRYRDGKFLRLLMEALKVRWHELKPGQIAAALRAHSRMRLHEPVWFDHALITLFEKQHDLTEKEAVNTLYSLLSLSIAARWTSGRDIAVTGETWFFKYEAVLHAMLAKASEHRQKMKYESIFQLQMLELYLKFIEPEIFALLSVEEKDLLERARRVNVVVDDYMQSSSKTHRQIARIFTVVGLHHRSEVYVGPFMLDILLGKKYVVEVDGPSHFFQDTNMRTTASLLKHTLLERMGYSVRHLPWQEWNQCPTHHKKLLYCASFWEDVLKDNAEALGGAQLADVVEALEEARIQEIKKAESEELLQSYELQDQFIEIDRMPNKTPHEKEALRNAARVRRKQNESLTDDEGDDDTELVGTGEWKSKESVNEAAKDKTQDESINASKASSSGSMSGTQPPIQSLADVEAQMRQLSKSKKRFVFNDTTDLPAGMIDPWAVGEDIDMDNEESESADKPTETVDSLPIRRNIAAKDKIKKRADAFFVSK